MHFGIFFKRKWVALFVIGSLLLLAFYVLAFNYNNPIVYTGNNFRFVVMGDSRGAESGINETTLRTLLKKVKKSSPQPTFILFSGDQVYGGPNVGTELAKWKAVVDDYYSIKRYYPSLGNHENDETIFSKAFKTLPNNQLPGYQRTAYYFNYGNARFIVLNSNRKDANGKYIISSSQRNWLESLLKNSSKTHNFVMFHVPAYPIGAHLGASLDGNPAERDALWDIIDKYNVTAIFVGHEHNYNRRLVDSSFNDNGYTFTNKIYQLTLGGAGAPLNSSAKNMKGVVVGPKAVYHYMIVDIAGSLASFKIYDINNNKIDSFSVDVSKRQLLR